MLSLSNAPPVRPWGRLLLGDPKPYGTLAAHPRFLRWAVASAAVVGFGRWYDRIGVLPALLLGPLGSVAAAAILSFLLATVGERVFRAGVARRSYATLVFATSPLAALYAFPIDWMSRGDPFTVGLYNYAALVTVAALRIAIVYRVLRRHFGIPARVALATVGAPLAAAGAVLAHFHALFVVFGYMGGSPPPDEAFGAAILRVLAIFCALATVGLTAAGLWRGRRPPRARAA